MAGWVRVLDRDGSIYTEGELADSWHLCRLRWPHCRLALLHVEDGANSFRAIVMGRRVVGRWQVVARKSTEPPIIQQYKDDPS
jgi:hypothetical protein